MNNSASDVMRWHCNICETTVDILETVDHIASLQHRDRAVRHPLGNLADESTGQYIRGTLGGGGGERTATAVDLEEDSSEAEESSDEDGEDDENEEIIIGNRLLWTCDICATTVNVFAREDHLRSRPHLRQIRAHSDQPPTPSTNPPTAGSWHCTICNEAMTVFHQAAHLISKPHLKIARIHRLEHTTRPATPHTPDHPDHIDYPLEQYPISPESARSTSYQFRETFYCITCAGEFDRPTQDLHLDTSELWDCTVCLSTVHPAGRELHLHSELHMAATRRQPINDFFYCSVCQRVCAQATKAAHLAGAAHQSMAVRQDHAAQYLAQHYAVQPAFNPLPQSWAPTPQAPQAYPVYCYICNQFLFGELLSTHLLWHFTTTTSAPPPVQPTPFHSHSAAPTPRPTTAPTAKPSKKNKYTKLYCDVCKKHKKASEMPSHTQSKKHLKKAALIALTTAPAATAVHPPVAGVPAASAPYITVSGDTFHCKVCARDRKVVGMEAHVKSNGHKKSLAAVRSALGTQR